jgi:hypothetical protein
METKSYQIRLANGALYVPSDSSPSNKQAHVIKSKFVANLFAKDLPGSVVEEIKG